ncbi:MAG: UxaA family hydrolase [Candidatus Aminicenantaceae bacterium]
MNKAIIVDPLDNVATTVTDLEAGSTVEFRFGSKKKVKVRQPIRFGHKFALTKITKGEKVIKYGEMIGRATQSIEEGDKPFPSIFL